jgi:hypothetical protein
MRKEAHRSYGVEVGKEVRWETFSDRLFSSPARSPSLLSQARREYVEPVALAVESVRFEEPDGGVLLVQVSIRDETAVFAVGC